MQKQRCRHVESGNISRVQTAMDELEARRLLQAHNARPTGDGSRSRRVQEDVSARATPIVGVISIAASPLKVVVGALREILKTADVSSDLVLTP